MVRNKPIFEHQNRKDISLMLAKRGWLVGSFRLLFTVAWLATGAPAVQAGDDGGATVDMVAVAHLDTQWRWTARETIEHFLTNTLHQNFRLFETYPNYRFNFEGSLRYEWMKEYYPEEFERLKNWIDQGRWHVAGPALDAIDVVMPAPESILRSILHAQNFYQDEFGLRALDFFLPDCFGFSFTLPTLARHAGIKGFSTQKLGWGSAAGIPFYLGLWEGIDGSVLPSVLHAGPYDWKLRKDVSQDEGLWRLLQDQYASTGLSTGYRYFGVGDQGGAPDESTVAWIARAVREGKGPLRVQFSSSGAIFDEDLVSDRQGLPLYRGELLMTRHGVGAYTSYSPVKYWSRENERMSAAAERAWVAVHALGGAEFPSERLRTAWKRFAWHHQHDGITGTSIPEANDIMINDLVVSFNQFSELLREAIRRYVALLDTLGPGIPVAVYNPSAHKRDDLVEMDWPVTNHHARLSVMKNGVLVPSQRIQHRDEPPRLAFYAQAPASGVAIYHVAEGHCAKEVEGLVVSAETNSLKAGDWLMTMNDDGHIVSIRQLSSGQEWLRDPVTWQFLDNTPVEWPAWEIEYEQIQAPPRHILSRPVKIEIIESGPVRARIRYTYRHDKTTLQQDVSVVCPGGVPRFEVDALINWQTKSNLLKVAFPAAFEDPVALYGLGLGHTERGVNTPPLYEVPAQGWAAIGERDQSWGLAVFSPFKYGWDRPDRHVLRHTIIHSPGDETRDFGRHYVRFAMAPLDTNWRDGLHRQAEDFNHPLEVFAVTQHTGLRPEVNALLEMETAGVRLLDLKMEERGQRFILRVGEMEGIKRDRVNVRFPFSPILEVREVNGLEDDMGPGRIENDAIVFALPAFGIRAWAVELAPPTIAVPEPESKPLLLPDTETGKTTTWSFLPNDVPGYIDMDGLRYDLSGMKENGGVGWSCTGQKLSWEESGYNRLSLLVASSNGDRISRWLTGGDVHVLRVPDMVEFTGLADHYTSDAKHAGKFHYRSAIFKRDAVAWHASRLMHVFGNIHPYTYGYLFRVDIPLKVDARSVILPDDPAIRWFAASLARDALPACRSLSTWRHPVRLPATDDQRAWSIRDLLMFLVIVSTAVLIVWSFNRVKANAAARR